MDFTLGNTSPTDTDTVAITEALNNAIDSLQDQLDAIRKSLNALSVDYNGFKESSTDSVASINTAIGRMQNDISDNADSIAGLSNAVTTNTLNAEEAAISSAHILSLKADALVDLPEIKPEAIKTENGDIDNLKADTIEVKNATLTNVTADNLNINTSLTVPEFTATHLNSTDLNTESADIEDARVNKLSVSGVPIECEDVKYSGWTNGYLHKLDVKANGILVFKLNEASIVVTPGDISSNYDKLYAAYRSDDGYWHIYFDTDLECQLLVVGTSSYSIADSLVLKPSVRRNADSGGQPNDGENIKVVVLNKLPSIGQRNVIYIILGDCAYYCDGQYFYEMASKKRN